MKLKAYIFASLLTILSFQVSYAQLLDDELADTETLVVHEELQKVTGRIIQITKAKDFTAVINHCSAILIGENTIVSAGHCFKRNEFLSESDVAQRTALQVLDSDTFYFDIPGVTSRQFEQDIASLADKNGVKIPNSNLEKLNEVLSRLPKIINNQILKEYEDNMPLDLSTYNARSEAELRVLANERKNHSWNYLGNVYDMNVAKLNKKLPASKITIETLDSNNTTIYASGFYGGNLSEPLRVIKCDNSRTVFEDLLPRAELDSFVTLLAHSDRLIVSACDGEIIQGQSGGPQVQYKDGKISLVGVNSGTIYGLSDHVISPRASGLKEKFNF